MAAPGGKYGTTKAASLWGWRWDSCARFYGGPRYRLQRFSRSMTRHNARRHKRLQNLRRGERASGRKSS